MRLAALALLSLTLSAAAQVPSDDARWDARFGAGGVLGEVTALHAAADGDVFVGGRFGIAGTVEAGNLARWDAATGTWDALEGGLQPRFAELFHIRSLAVAGDALWVSGYFRAQTGTYETADHLARFDLAARTWSEPVAGLDPGSSGALLAADDAAVYLATGAGLLRYDLASGALESLADGLAVTALDVADGQLVVGGSFGSVGGVAARNVARYDVAAGTWHALGTGVGSPPTAIDVRGAVVTVGGVTEAGGADVWQLAAWDGSAWAGVGGGISRSASWPGVADLDRAPDGTLYVTGQFDTAGGVPVYNVARFDGAAWHAMPVGVRGGGVLAAVAVTPDGSMAYVGGATIQGTGPATVGLAGWSVAAEAWAPLLDGPALGAPYASVGALTTAPDGTLYGVATDRLGQTELPGGYGLAQVVRWTGDGWAAVGDLTPYLGTEQYGSSQHGLVLEALAVGPDGALYAAGQTTHQFVASSVWNYSNRPILLRWDGDAWARLDGNVAWTPISSLYGGTASITALDVSGTTLYVGGSFLGWTPEGEPNDPSWGGVVAYDTETGVWSRVGGGIQVEGLASMVRALAVVPETGDLYAGGGFESAGGNSVRALARFDGDRWHGVRGGGLTGESESTGIVQALAVADGALVVGGWFSDGGGTALNGIGSLDLETEAWSAMSGGVTTRFGSGTIASLAVRGGQVFVGGTFTDAADVDARNVAVWQNGAWGALGSGVRPVYDENGIGGSATALAVVGDALFVGGDFQLAGARPSLGVARYDIGPAPNPTDVAPVPDAAARLTLGPNPTTGRTTARFTLAAAGPVRLDVFDVLGRRVASVAAGVLGAGPAEVALDAAALGLPSGLYSVRLADERGGATWLTVVR